MLGTMFHWNYVILYSFPQLQYNFIVLMNISINFFDNSHHLSIEDYVDSLVKSLSIV